MPLPPRGHDLDPGGPPRGTQPSQRQDPTAPGSAAPARLWPAACPAAQPGACLFANQSKQEAKPRQQEGPRREAPGDTKEPWFWSRSKSGPDDGRVPGAAEEGTGHGHPRGTLPLAQRPRWARPRVPAALPIRTRPAREMPARPGVRSEAPAGPEPRMGAQRSRAGPRSPGSRGRGGTGQGTGLESPKGAVGKLRHGGADPQAHPQGICGGVGYLLPAGKALGCTSPRKPCAMLSSPGVLPARDAGGGSYVGCDRLRRAMLPAVRPALRQRWGQSRTMPGWARRRWVRVPCPALPCPSRKHREKIQYLLLLPAVGQQSRCQGLWFV